MKFKNAPAALARARPGYWRRRAGELSEQRDSLRARLAHLEAAPRRAGLGYHVLPENEPSFMRLLTIARRQSMPLRTADTNRLDPVHPRRAALHKLFNNALAASHGVPLAEPLAIWERVQDISLGDLPDRFVVKSVGGSSGRGVLPLERTHSGHYRIIGTQEPMTSQDVTARLRHGVLRPFFAEALLQPETPGELLPDDAKFYCCYGDVVHGMVRRLQRHADIRSARYRYLDSRGADLEVGTTYPNDPSVPAPRHYAQMIEVASVLSRSLPFPFIRVDLYDTPQGIRFGELTPLPGGTHGFEPHHERDLGARWELAQLRLELDLASGARPFTAVPGTHPVPRLLEPWRPPTPSDPRMALAAVHGQSHPANAVPGPEVFHQGSLS